MRQTYKYVGLPSLNQVCKKRAGQKIFLMLISEKFFILAMFPFQIYYPSYVSLGEQSKLLVLSSALFFSCFCCFDVSYPLSSVQVSLDFATLGHQKKKKNNGRLGLQHRNMGFIFELSFKKLWKYIFVSHIKIAWS